MSESIKNKTVDEYLVEALKSVTSLVEGEYLKKINSRGSSNHDMGCVIVDAPNLIAAHAQLTLMSYGIKRIATALEGGRAALEEIAESVDFIAARPDSNEAGEVPTKREREIMYRALEADYLSNNTPANPEEMDASLRRLKKIVGL